MIWLVMWGRRSRSCRIRIHAARLFHHCVSTAIAAAAILRRPEDALPCELHRP